MMVAVVFEMETSDPDDFMTLLWLADHPLLDLRAVLVTPGSQDQCQLVRWGLDQCGRQDIPIGAFHGHDWWLTSDGQKSRVSGFHYKVYGRKVLAHDVGEIALGPSLLESVLRTTDATVLVGSAPKNIGYVFKNVTDLKLSRWVQQGGFAGDNLVAEPLAKFKGRITCPSFNPGGAPQQTLALLASPHIEQRLFVSKNVCHGVIWDRDMQSSWKQRLGLSGTAMRTGLRLLVDALEQYLCAKGSGKAMHDLVAAACVQDEEVCEFKEVEIYREKGEWGARSAMGSNTRISVGFDKERFLAVFAT
jgi:hypothetical protein